MRTTSLFALLAKTLIAASALLCGLLPHTALADGGATLVPGAVLAPIAPGAVVRPYAHSALRLASRLTDGYGRPVAGAAVQIMQRVDGQSEWETVGMAVTGADGVLDANVPPGPSRTIDLAYGPLQDGGFVAQAEMVETVTAGLVLRTNTIRTSPTGWVMLEGAVLGAVPSSGVVVEVLVYYHGVWQPIRTPRTDVRGRVRVAYRFQRAYGRFPFRLRVRRGQVGFPYGDGESAWVEVAT